MTAFIDDRRDVYGGEPICRVLPIATSTYHEHAAHQRDPSRRPARERRGVELFLNIRRVFEENFYVYGVRKVWRQMKRDGIDVARCTVARLMRNLVLRSGLLGEVRSSPARHVYGDGRTVATRD